MDTYRINHRTSIEAAMDAPVADVAAALSLLDLLVFASEEETFDVAAVRELLELHARPLMDQLMKTERRPVAPGFPPSIQKPLVEGGNQPLTENFPTGS